jgi:hypothetical protein
MNCEWIAECPDWGRTVEAKTLQGLISKMRKLAEKAKKRCPRCKGELMFCGCYDRRDA